ncbi:MAG: hypothetical protein ACOCYU_02185 [Brevefilum sp.]
MDGFEKNFEELIILQEKVKGLNPALHKSYPVALVVDNRFQVFDFAEEQKIYKFVKDLPTPMPIPEGVRAAFQLEGYGGRIACVVTPDVFDTREGYVTLLHEFVHCYQYETCEQDLKMTLDIACQAQEQGDFMWEIQHPFPYVAEEFIRSYSKFLGGLEAEDPGTVNESRQALRTYLGVHDYEYMVWQEWKEGFARWVENRIKRYLDLPENKGGLGKPYSRVLFYVGGEKFIAYLAKLEPGLTSDLQALFHRMLAIPSA